MTQFHNKPMMKNDKGEWCEKQYVHQPLTFDDYGVHVKIQENGKVLLSSSGVKNPETGDIEYDEIEIPASLVFKLAGSLKLTRTEHWVPVESKEKQQA